MAQPPHIHMNGAVYFVTTRLERGQSDLDALESEIVQTSLLDLSKSNEISLYAYVVMPDHLHALLKPAANGISKIMQLLKGRTARKINMQREAMLKLGRENFSIPASLWQKGYFDFTVFTEKKYKEKFNYIHHNPVKRGLVGKAEDYQYSSAREYKEKYGEIYYQ